MRDVVRRRLRILAIAAGTLPLLALLAAPVQAVDTLTVTTPYPTVEVDPGGTVKLPIEVQTPTATKVDLTLNGVPQGWEAAFHGGGFIVTSVYTNGNDASPEPSDLQLQVVVPADAKPGHNQFTVHAAAGSSGADLPIDFVVAQAGGGSVSFSTDVPAKRGAPGAAISFDLTLHNDTATEQSFSLSVPDAPSGWEVTAQPASESGATSFKVSAGDTSSISVSATSSATETAGNYTFHVVASSGSQYNTAQELGVQISGSTSLSVSSQSGTLNTSATAGEPTNFTILVVNTGSAPIDNVTLSNSPPTNWKVTYTPASIATLSPNDQATVVAAIQPANDAVAGDYVVTLTATSGSATDSIDVRTQVQASTLWGYIGLAIIALVFIALLLRVPPVRAALTMMATAPSVAIRTRSLEKRYGGVVAVQPLDLEVRAGEVFGLLGPNGAGKTTTILMLLGLTEPTGGHAEVLGMDPARNPLKVKRHVGYLPDNVGFYPGMTGRQNLRYTCRLNGIPNVEAESRIDQLLDQVRLAGRGDDRVDTYSRGMLQRLGLADALVKDPSILILDEPTTAIDPIGVAETLALVQSLAHDRGVSVLLSSHLLHQVQQICDRIAIFVRGAVAATGSVADLARSQQTGAQIQMEIGVDGDQDAVEATLRAVPGVADVRRDVHDARILVVTGESDIHDGVVRALIAADQVPWLLRNRGMSLDEIYQRYFGSPGEAQNGGVADA